MSNAAQPSHKSRFTKKTSHVIALSFLAGMLWLVGIRFITYQPEVVHYHANFALFVDGQRHSFERFTFYEEVESCGGDNTMNPKIRTHMHDQVSHVAHVHDEGATWGHFFANLGMTHGDTVFRTDTDTFVEGDATEISFLLNDQEVSTTANSVIGDEDVLLVSINTQDISDEALRAQYAQIMTDAGVYNQEADPAACAGNADLSFTDRLKRAVGVFGE